MLPELREVTGRRGENIVELCLTNYKDFDAPLFRPGFLGDKWPSIDFYVELQAVRKRRPYFFAQAKATTAGLSQSLRILVKKKDIERLLQIPGPTYIFGHCCPVKSRTESIGCRDRVSRDRSRMREVPVKWAFSRKE
jgi:hypothetical protein